MCLGARVGMTTVIPSNLLERLRASEIEDARRWFPDGATVLDVGGGNGFQARLLASQGYKMSVIDLKDAHFPWHTSYFPVTYFDGCHIPFGDQSFDVVFSSNVLEHVPVKSLPGLLAEMRRVLKPGGVMVHLMPTPTWRFWTAVTLYPSLLRRLASRIRRTVCVEAGRADATTGPHTRDPAALKSEPVGSRAAKLAKMLWPHAHGEYPSAAHELYFFSPGRWRRLLRSNGLQIIATYPTGMFYTGEAIFPSMPLGVRRVLAKVLGSACCVFVARPASDVADLKQRSSSKSAA